MSYLDEVNSPKDIKKLNIDELYCLCDEIRDLMIKTVSKNGGHLSSNLGVVELTVDLHKVFNSPNDPAILRASMISFRQDTHLPLFLPLSDLQRLRPLKAIRARL